MDGNYSNTYDVRMPRADTLVWLDYARSVCVRRVLLRTLTGYGRTRPDLPESCPERFDLTFLSYVWDFSEKPLPRIVNAIESLWYILLIYDLADVSVVSAFV